MTSSPPSRPSRDDTKTADVEAYHDEAVKPGYGAPGVVDNVVSVVDHKAERALCLRFDIRILPMLTIMCEFFTYTIYYPY